MNWKKCLDYSSGHYIKVLFSDDLIHPKCIEMMLPKLESYSEVGFVYSNVLIFKSSKRHGTLRYSMKKLGNMIQMNLFLILSIQINFQSLQEPLCLGGGTLKKI